MLLGNHTLQVQKVLHAIKLGSRVRDQPFTADDKKLFQWKPLEPSLEESRVYTNFNCSVVCVDQLIAAVNKRKLLELLHVLVLAERLRVVADCTRNWIPHNQQQSKNNKTR